MSEHRHELTIPGSKRWDEYKEKLKEWLEKYSCDHTHYAAQRVLAQLGLEPCCQYMSLGYFIANGAYCSCEVLMNVGAERRGKLKRIRKPAKKRVKK